MRGGGGHVGANEAGRWDLLAWSSGVGAEIDKGCRLAWRDQQGHLGEGRTLGWFRPAPRDFLHGCMPESVVCAIFMFCVCLSGVGD